ncbi:transglutaminase-like domain-containing protein [Gabonibacter massiliensis]|uniref:transglutaminase-like domain-containing protein n=1 Tax=Gabonibacter massiliensis TaxID=1720195 RepID=UPI00073E220A|nr:transglutaminase-like domain-containing protein [Gabonibacter massiliensis]
MKLLIIGLVMSLFFTCCKHPHFISDRDYRVEVRHDFDRKRDLLIKSTENLLEIFDTPMNWEEREAMEFLYAYSPLVDISMQSGAFFLKNVRASLRAKEEMPWGKEIPEVIFRHFVLPVRGGKEALDSSRVVFYRELKDRVRGCKSMEEAALEVNHWCHEKVVYRPTDARTFSPLATVSTAYGRCGEESVFALAALRAVAIPARQIYTPRWAHCDDNHAWIEVWVDGDWKYLGACEPEPRLNMAWFTVPVQQAVYVEADVFGRYKGDEEVVYATGNSTGINVTSHYTKVVPTVVQVVDSLQQPVAGAKVEYRLFNYGEYYPVATLYSDKDGKSRLTLGLGDLIVWVSKGEKYGFGKYDVREGDTLRIVLNKDSDSRYAEEYILVPPVAEPVTAIANSEERALNDKRFTREDSIRNAYIASFMQEREAEKIARDLGVDPERFVRFVKISRGNYEETVRFIREISPERRGMAMALLSVVPEKDLQDTPARIWTDHLNSAWKYRETPMFKEYVLNPRIRNEFLTAYRSLLTDYLSKKRISSVSDLTEEIDRICLVDSIYPAKIITPPEGVLRTGFTDSRSRDVFFVAACRSLGIPARIDPISGRPEYYEAGNWKSLPVVASNIAGSKGRLMIRYKGDEVKDPHYFLNFTIAQLKDRAVRTVDLGSNAAVDMGAGASLKSIFAKPVTLEEGSYLLITGNRRSDGAALSGMTSFRVRADEITVMDMRIVPCKETSRIEGYIDPDLVYGSGKDGGREFLSWPSTGYTALALIEADKEPTNHLLRDVSGMKSDFEELGIPMTFIFRNKEQWEKFDRSVFRLFPAILSFGYDIEGRIRSAWEKTLELKTGQLPCVVVANRKGEVIFVSQGYRVGLGTQLFKMLQLK